MKKNNIKYQKQSFCGVLIYAVGKNFIKPWKISMKHFTMKSETFWITDTCNIPMNTRGHHHHTKYNLHYIVVCQRIINYPWMKYALENIPYIYVRMISTLESVIAYVYYISWIWKRMRMIIKIYHFWAYISLYISTYMKYDQSLHILCDIVDANRDVNVTITANY